MEKVLKLINSGNREDVILGILLLKNLPKEQVDSFLEECIIKSTNSINKNYPIKQFLNPV